MYMMYIKYAYNSDTVQLCIAFLVFYLPVRIAVTTEVGASINNK